MEKCWCVTAAAVCVLALFGSAGVAGIPITSTELTTAVDTAANENSTQECDLCQQKRLLETLTVPQQEELHIEYIKATILSKLRMTKPPELPLKSRMMSKYSLGRVTRKRHNENDPDQDSDQDNSDFYPQPGEIVRFADSVYICGEKTICLNFAFGDVLRDLSVNKAQLYIFFERWWTQSNSHTLTVKDTSLAFETVAAVADHSLYPFSKWEHVHITKSASLWAQTGAHTANLAIKCSTCEWNEFIRLRNGMLNKLPYMEVLTTAAKNRRRRSNTGCTGDGKSCCLKRLEVSFEDIGWDSWIIDPPSYSPNICQGSCSNQPMLLANHHAHVIMDMANSQQNPLPAGLSYTPCCSPNKMDSLQLTYFDDDGNIQSKKLPNMIAKSCGCS